MTILVTSDWHLDDWTEAQRAPDIVPHLKGLDALILAGDLAEDPLRTWPLYLGWLGRHIDPAKVFVMPGNHDYYHHHLNGEAAMRAIVAEAGMQWAQKRVLVFGDVRILCCTLWADFGLFGAPEAAMDAALWLPDFSMIRRDAQGAFIAPQDTAALHRAHRAWLTQRIRAPHAGRTVIVTHHLPTAAVGGLRTPVSPFFASRLDPWIRTHAPDLWLCGHAHRHHEARIGATVIRDVSFGYPHEVQPGQDAALLQRGFIDTERPGLLVG